MTFTPTFVISPERVIAKTLIQYLSTCKRFNNRLQATQIMAAFL